MPLPNAYPPGPETLPDIGGDEYAALEDMTNRSYDEAGSLDELFEKVATNNPRIIRVMDRIVSLQLVEERPQAITDYFQRPIGQAKAYPGYNERLIQGGWDGHRFVTAAFTHLAIVRSRLSGIDELIDHGGSWTHLPIRTDYEETQTMRWLWFGRSDQVGWDDPRRHRVEASGLLDAYIITNSAFDSLYSDELDYKQYYVTNERGFTELEVMHYSKGFAYGAAHGLCIYALSERLRMNHRTPQ
jgi:hypothetical protein